LPCDGLPLINKHIPAVPRRKDKSEKKDCPIQYEIDTSRIAHVPHKKNMVTHCKMTIDFFISLTPYGQHYKA
jgi:hypothetical protein